MKLRNILGKNIKKRKNIFVEYNKNNFFKYK